MNNTLTTRVNSIEKSLSGIMSMLEKMNNVGTQKPSSSSAKSSARVSQSASNANFASKAKKGGKGQVEDVTITITQSMLEGRMKLPARMFTKGTKLVIDGHVITQQANDQGRSSKFDPAIFGYDLDAGDVITFSHVSGREWEVAEVAEGDSAPARKPATSSKKQSRGSSSAKSNKPASTNKPQRVQRDEGQSESLKQGIKRFGAIAVTNANTKGFKQNDNIKSTGTFELDARVFFTTKESRQFNAFRKRNGLTLTKAVTMLNAEVYE